MPPVRASILDAAIRAALLVGALVAFFIVGAPLQWLVARRAPRFARAIPRLFCRTILSLSRVEVASVGALPRGRPVLAVANHVSWIDILALGTITPFCFVAKSEVSRWPIVSAFADVQGTVFVDRLRRRTIPASNRAMAARMMQGRAVLLFPEGTTIGTRHPGRFLTSHFAAARDAIAAGGDRVAVQPVAIRYSSEAAAWVGDDTLLSHIWRTLRAPPILCHVCFAAPLDYAVTSDRKHVARLARAAIVAQIDALSVSARPRLDPAEAISHAPGNEA